MRRCSHDLHVEDGSEAAHALRSDAQCVYLLIQLDTQFLHPTLWSACDDLLDVDGLHQRFLRHDHRLLRGAADADSQHTRRTPSGSHGGNRLHLPADYGIRGREHGELGLVFRAAAFCRHLDVYGIAGDDLVVDDRGSVVLGVFPDAFGWADYRGTQYVVWIQVGSPDALVHQVGDAQGRRAGVASPANIHADLHEHGHDAGVLANRPASLGAHAAVGEDLGDGVLCRRALLQLVGPAEGGDVIERVVVADVLQRVGYALDEIFLFYDDHV